MGDFNCVPLTISVKVEYIFFAHVLVIFSFLRQRGGNIDSSYRGGGGVAEE